MRAFLSHSSKDKSFVSEVAKTLGSLQIEFDEQTFETTLNTAAIRKALSRSDLFVLFASKSAIASPFVAEEERTALELRGKGSIKDVLVFIIDDSSYNDLPQWLRDLNIVSKITSAKACARKIQSLLLKLSSQSRKSEDLYIGREDDERSLREALAVPADRTPIFLHAVGHTGIGRRTFIVNSLQKYYPRLFSSFVEITIGKYDGPESMFRQIYGLTEPTTIHSTIEAIEKFRDESESVKAETLAAMLAQMVANGEFVIIEDDGGVYDEDGKYQDYIRDIYDKLSDLDRPILGFVQTRMMPSRERQVLSRAFHRHLRPLPDIAVKEIIGLKLNQAAINFTDESRARLANLMDGHPVNIIFAIKYVESYGLQSLLADPSELVSWKRHRAEEFLSRLVFTETQIEILAILSAYRFVSIEMILSVVKGDQFRVASDLRMLEDFCCIERRDEYYYISAPVGEGIRRMDLFARSDAWRLDVGQRFCEIVKDYKDDDSISISVLETATMAVLRGAKAAPAFIETLILPSHLLQIAREYYDNRRYGPCAEFCKRCWDMKERLPKDAQVEALRIWGLSAARLKNTVEFDNCITLLGDFNSKFSRRVKFFLKGFQYRISGKLELAEVEFISAYRLANKNQSINRELASLYCREKRYPEAEHHARIAYSDAPTNPFIIDIMAETLLGKQEMGLHVDPIEFERIMSELMIYGDAPGSSFHLIREGQKLAKERNYPAALSALSKAITRTANLPAPYLIRARVYLQMNKLPEAEGEIKQVNIILDRNGLYKTEHESEIHELESKILIERTQFQAAKDKISKSAFLTQGTKARLFSILAKAVAFAPGAADASMKAWAKNYGK